ncbi:MAG: T9SS type A sorting domain-containing protein [Ignavibacteriaceae bacterium]|nr:T9SS type A sorting domain-containing protein [Ignavibacteriaceae bacterium]
MGIKCVLVGAAILICSSFSLPQQKHLSKPLDDDNSKYTNVGNIGLAVSNYGIYGNGLVNLTQLGHQPSCEYPIGSGIEHIFQGGLWVGGFIKNTINSLSKTGPFVTTGAVDNTSGYRRSGYEFTNNYGSSVVERSSLLDSRYYTPLAISHQDFISDFTDTNRYTLDGTPIVDHNPLGITVHEENYAWNFSYANFFVIKNYTITNITGKWLDSVYVGLWTEAVVRDVKISYTKNAAFYVHGGVGYDDSLNMAYAFDVDGDVPYTNSYVGFLYLGSTPTINSLFLVDNGSGGKDTLPATCFNSWGFNNTTDPNFFAPPDGPTGDLVRYQKMQGWFGGTNRFNPYYNSPGPLYHTGINPDVLKIAGADRSELITHGYYKNIAPGESINIAYAVVCAGKFGDEPTALDTRLERTNLYNNADMALSTYFGNDLNRNGIVDPHEDIYGDGLVHHYTFYPLILTSPVANEHCVAGYPHNLTWRSSISDNVKIEYSTNNGVNWITITSATPANTESYSWLVPNTPSTTCHIRITYNAFPAIQWISKDVFTISATNTPPQIAWNTLSTHPDTSFTAMTFGWDAADIDGNNNIQKINIALNDTTHFVTLNAATNSITIRTSDFSNPNPLMDIYINGDPANQPVDSLGNRVKLPGLVYNSNNVFYVQAIDIYNAKSPWISSATQPKSNPGWFVKKPQGKIALVNNYSAYDNPGTFYPNMMDSLNLSGKYDIIDLVNQPLPYINLTFFETAKLFNNILWYTDNNPSLDLANATVQKITNAGVKIFFSMLFPQTINLTQIQGFLPVRSDTSSYLSVIAPNKMVSDTSHSGYPALTIATSFQRLRGFYLTPNATPIYYFPNKELSGYIGFENSSKNIFFIGMPLHKINGIPGSVKNLLQKVLLNDFNAPFIQLTSPAASEALTIASVYSLSWKSNMVSNVKIEYSTDQGTSWITIIGSTDCISGSYVWTVPNTPSENCALRISDISNPAVYSMNYFAIRPVTGIRDNNKSLSYKLQQNYPNPFNPSTTINYSLSREGHTKITIYNILGSKVAVLVNENKPAGIYSVQFNANALPSGIYFYRLESGSYSDIKKFVLMK